MKLSVAVPSHSSKLRLMLRGPFLALVCLLVPTTSRAQVQLVPVITTVAGNGSGSYSGDGGPATSAELYNPLAVALDASGNLYIAEYSNNRVRKVSPSGIITTVAGNGSQGYSGDNGPATSAELYHPFGVALDASGNLYIADWGNDRIRMVSPSGIITTVAGNGTPGYSGDNGPATSAELNYPTAVALDASGNIYIADVYNSLIRMVSAGGIITTVAGNGTQGYSGDNGLATSAELDYPSGLALDASGDLYIADEVNNRIRMVSPSGIITTVAGNGTQGYSGDNGPATSAELNSPTAVALDAFGNLYITDNANSRIREVSPSGIITTVAGNGTQGYSGDNGPATDAELSGPNGVVLDASGNLYIADEYTNRIREVSEVSPGLNETITSFPTTALGSSASVQNVLIQTTATETIIRISVPVSQGGFQEFSVGAITGCTIGVSNASGTACTIPITFTPAYPGLRQLPLQVVTSAGNVSFGLQGTGTGPQVALTPGIITTVAGNGTSGFSGDNGPATSAEVVAPYDVALDASGNLYIADNGNNRIRKVDPSGIINTVAGNGTQGYSGDNGPATSAELYHPLGVALDASGNLYIADTYNSRIRMVSPSGIITTVAGNGTQGYSGDNGPATSAELSNPQGVALDASGNLYIADTYNSRIRMVSSSGIITTVAGKGTGGYSGDNGPATSAELFNPGGVALDASGNLYIADTYNSRIRMVSPRGMITTVAGNGSYGYSGDNGPATSAELWYPGGVALDASGNLYIAGNGDERIRKVSLSGIIITVAGNGDWGYFGGDNGPATSAVVWAPTGVALDPSGNLHIADNGNNRIRKVNVGITAALNFANTAVGSQSTDSPQSFELSNIGNTALTFSIPSTGNNPSIPPGFSYDALSTCPLLSTASSAFSLDPGADCTFAVDFIPTATSTNNGNLVLSDNTLNYSGTTQTVSLNGTGEVGTTITLGSSLNPSIYGQAVTITATVAPATGTVAPAGTVQFSVDGTPALPPANLIGGTATYTSSTLTVGTHNITATFTPVAGDGFLSSTSIGLSQVVTIFGPLVAPVIFPGGGSYNSAQMVTLTDAISGAVFYYTTDGSIPTTNSNLYTGPITVSSSETISAIAAASGYSPSHATTAAYLISPLAVGGTVEWTWMGGSNTAGTFGQTNTSGQAGVYGTLGVPAASNIPGGRVSPTTWTDSQGNLWLFGGLGYDAAGTSGNLNDVWMFNPATNLWAWMGGSSTVGTGGGQPGVYGTLGTPSAGNIPGGRYSASVWIDGSGNVWLFGGGGYDVSDSYGPLSDLWEFNPSTNMWTWKGGSNTANQAGVYGTLGTPSASNNPGGQTSTSTWIDNNGNFWMLGSGFWEFNPSSSQWTWMGGVACQSVGCVSPSIYGTLGVPAAGNFPGSRGSSSSWTDSNGNFWLFGGYVGSNGAMVNDTWEFNPSTNQWAWMGGSNGSACGGQGCGIPPTYGTEGIPGNGNNPGARVNATNWADSGGNLWLFGGNSNYTGGNFGNLNDLWEFNTSTNQWTWMGGSSSLGSTCFLQWGATWCGQDGVYGTLGTPSPANIPGGRSSASGSATGASWIDNNGNLWLFGGWAFDANGSSGYLNDLWEYQPPAASLPAAATPTFSVPAGTYNAAQTVTISDTTNGATIYYTTNGTTPNRASSVFSNPISVSATETLKAVAVGPNYKRSAVASADYTINLAVTPSITWAAPGPISYGTPLSATQLDAISSVPGTFVYSRAAGTVLPAGTQTLSVTFTPTDTANYTTTSTTTQLTVKKSVPSITWAPPASIPYGTALTATQLDASSTAAGLFVYSPAAGALLSVGSHTLSVTFSPTDTNDYSSATTSVVLKVVKATPVISWLTPAPITFGTALSGTQLDATSPLAGTFVYSPAAGKVLAVGSHTLSVKFTPTNTTDYTTTTATVTLTVGQAPTTLTLASSSLSPTLGSSITLTATATSIAGTPTGAVTFYAGATSLGKGTVSGGVATLSTSALPVGLQSVTAVYGGSTNYASTTSNAVSVTVGQDVPSLTLSVSSAGSALGTKFTFTALLSNTVAGKAATGSVSFTVDGSPVATNALASNKTTYAFTPSAGMHTVTAIYTGDSNYLAAPSNAITITVSKATPSIKFTSSSLTVKRGVSVTFTVKLSNLVATFPPSGNVQFYDGVTQIGVGPISSGTATFSISTLGVGIHTMTAVYVGDPNYGPITSGGLQERVN